MRLTNKNIIRELLPKLHRAIKSYEDGINPYTYNVGGHKYLEVKMYLQGKYDGATLSWSVGKPKEQGLYYTKEYTGCGNGYYAIVDYYTGKIRASEWD